MARGDYYQGDVKKILKLGKKIGVVFPDGKGAMATVGFKGTFENDEKFINLEFADGKIEKYRMTDLKLRENSAGNWFISMMPDLPKQDFIMSNADKQMIKEFALEKDGQKLKYSVNDIYNLVKEDIKLSYDNIEKLISDFREEYLIDNLVTSLSDIDNTAKDFVRKDSTAAVEKSLNLLKQNFQSYKQVETDEIRRVFDLPEDKIIHYPIELFKLILSHYDNTLSNEIIGFSIKELNFERKLTNIVSTYDKSLTKIFTQSSVNTKMDLLKEILVQIQVKRNLIKKKYKHVVERFNQFSIFKQRQIDDLGIFTTEDDVLKYEKDIPIVILLYIEYYYFLNGKYIDSKLLNNILAYYSIVGFNFSNDQVHKYNGLKLAFGSDNFYDLIDEYIDRKIIDFDDRLNITMTIPFITMKQQYMEEILAKTEEIYVKGLDSFNNSDPIIQVVPKIIQFNVTPTSLTSTSQIEISWAVENSISVNISGLGEVSADGKRVIKFSDIFDIETKCITIVANRDSKFVKQSVDITLIPEPPHQIVSLDTLDANYLIERQSTTKVKKPTLEEYMNSDKPIPKDFLNSTNILYITLTVFTMGILLFLWSERKVEYKANTIADGTSVKSAEYLGVDEYIHEMNSGKTQIFSVKDHPKAHGADWKLKIPISWEYESLVEPNYIYKFSPKQIEQPIYINIISNVFETNGSDMTKSDTKEFFESNYIPDVLAKGGEVIRREHYIIDGIPSYIAEIEIEKIEETTNINYNIRSLNFIFIVKNIMFTINCNVYSSNLDEDLTNKMKIYAPLFNKIIKSINVNINNPEMGNKFIKDKINTQGIVNSDGVNIRSAPDLDSFISGMVYKGEEFSILEKSDEAMTINPHGSFYWYLIENDNNKGWIFGRFLDIH